MNLLERTVGGRSSGGDRRWYSVTLVTAAIAISYFDRQTLPVAIAAVQHNIPISNQQFSYLQSAFLLSYAALYIGGGRLLDRLGTRRGFLIIMLWWSVACALHGLASGFALLLAARFLLGMGEGGAFPAAVRVVAEWIPAEQRSTAVGIINAGTAIGSVLAPPLIGFVILHSGWRAVFFSAGAVGVVWVLWWATSYRNNDLTLSTNTLDARLAAYQLSIRELLAFRSVQTIVFAKFMSDSAWYFLLFWLPKYLYDARHFDVKQVSYYAWIPYAASGVGSSLEVSCPATFCSAATRSIKPAKSPWVSAPSLCQSSCWCRLFPCSSRFCCSALPSSVSSPGQGSL
jgi:ACS family hexuronate transporter-like MFS transporter